MTDSPPSSRDTKWIVASCAVLSLALGGALVMLLRAKSAQAEVEAVARQTELAGKNATLRGQVAELSARKLLMAFPRKQDSLESFRAILMVAAEQFRKDPLSGTPAEKAFASEAIEFSAGDSQIQIWTSGLIDDGIRQWAIDSIADQLKEGVEGSAHVEEQSRILGQSWAVFEVEGQARIGGVVWLTPR